MSDCFYKIIPENEVEPERVKKTKKVLERCKELFGELTELDLPEFEFKWIKLTDKGGYESDQLYFKLQEGINQLIGSNKMGEPLEKKFLKNVDNFYGMFSHKLLSGKDRVIYLRSDIPLYLISETTAHEFYHLAFFAIGQKGSSNIVEGWDQEWMAEEFSKNLLKKYPELR